MEEDFGPRGLIVTIFSPPNGKSVEHEIRNVTPDDARWFNDNNIKVSMEELMTGEFVIYGCKVGTPEENECIYIVPKNQTCIEAMGKLRKLCEFAYNENSEWTEWE